MDNSSDSSSDVERIEMLWDNDITTLIRQWADRCEQASKAHYTRAKWYKRYYRLASLFSATIPLVSGAFDSQLSATPNLQAGLMLCAGVVSTINAFLNLGQKAQEHFTAEFLFIEFKNECDSELVKAKKHRLQADVFLERCLNKYNKLVGNAPVL